MPRTTVDIEAPLLKEIKRLQREEGVPMGKLICRLLADALANRRKAEKKAKTKLRWVCREMKPLVDLADKEAVYAELDRDRR
jgi:hypothetical protein